MLVAALAACRGLSGAWGIVMRTQNTLEVKQLHSVGRVTLTVQREIDTDPDTSWLGQFCNYREPMNENQKLVHLRSGLVLDHHGIWRDNLGRIQAAPEEYQSGRDYQYTFHDNGHDKIKYAVQDSQRLEQINMGNIGFYGIVATVSLDGVEIGHASCWGFESDSDEDYLESEERNFAHEALREAKAWRIKNLRKEAA